MSDPVPAIAEVAASGETAAIFADIRHVLGVAVVNLIWRHLATIPGALPAAWGMLRPLYADGTITAEATALHRDIALPALPGFPAEALALVGVGAAELAPLRSILAAYDRTNAMALVALSALAQRLSANPAVGQTSIRHHAGDQAANAEQIPLPPLPAMAELAPDVASLVSRLNGLGTRRATPILASMYRHLAHWPGYLALAWMLVAPLNADGTLDQLIAAALANAQARAVGLAAGLVIPTPIEAPLSTAIVPRSSHSLATSSPRWL
ncbi:MAG: hypothetical protein JO001_25405 [Alphaproteobacteria bacterium]|nr:hypothetical protein [Alphaproteobacteria bacterium]